jgi:hypothetical protein
MFFAIIIVLHFSPALCAQDMLGKVFLSRRWLA